MESFLVDNFMP